MTDDLTPLQSRIITIVGGENLRIIEGTRS